MPPLLKKRSFWHPYSLISLCSVSVLLTTLHFVPFFIGWFMDPPSQLLLDYYNIVSVTCFHATHFFTWISMIFKRKYLVKIIKKLSKTPITIYQNHPRNFSSKFTFVIVFINVLEEIFFEDMYVKRLFLNLYPALIINLNLYLMFLLMKNATQQFIIVNETTKSKNCVLDFHKLVERINFYSKWQLCFVLFLYCTFILEVISFESSGTYVISNIATITVVLITADYPHDKV